MTEPRHPGGARSLLTIERQQRIVQSILAGNYEETAALAGGISKPTFHRWMARGRDCPAPTVTDDGVTAHTDERYRLFHEAVIEARAQAEERNVMIIQQAAQTTWQAAAWWLERSFPKRYGRRNDTDEPTGGESSGELSLAALDAEIEKLTRELETTGQLELEAPAETETP